MRVQAPAGRCPRQVVLMKRSPIRRKTPLSAPRPAIISEIVRIGLREFTIPPGTSKARRRAMIAALESHVLATGDITLAEARKILAKYARPATRIARGIVRSNARSKYAARPRDSERMMFVKSLRCAAKTYSMTWRVDCSTACGGPIEADHMGQRPVGRKAPDDTCGPLCRDHHVERTAHTGMFKHATRAELRQWMDAVIARTRELYERRTGRS